MARRWLRNRVGETESENAVSESAEGPTSPREAGHQIELPKQLAHDLVRVFLGAEVLELIQNSRDGTVGIGDRALDVTSRCRARHSRCLRNSSR